MGWLFWTVGWDLFASFWFKVNCLLSNNASHVKKDEPYFVFTQKHYVNSLHVMIVNENILIWNSSLLNNTFTDYLKDIYLFNYRSILNPLLIIHQLNNNKTNKYKQQLAFIKSR